MIPSPVKIDMDGERAIEITAVKKLDLDEKK